MLILSQPGKAAGQGKHKQLDYDLIRRLGPEGEDAFFGEMREDGAGNILEGGTNEPGLSEEQEGGYV